MAAFKAAWQMPFRYALPRQALPLLCWRSRYSSVYRRALWLQLQALHTWRLFPDIQPPVVASMRIASLVIVAVPLLTVANQLTSALPPNSDHVSAVRLTVGLAEQSIKSKAVANPATARQRRIIKTATSFSITSSADDFLTGMGFLRQMTKA